MCGIIGLWNHGRDDVEPSRFRAAVGALAHRGPDGEGVFHDPEVRLHLGHRRLAILDPTSAGAQPMASDDDGLIIVYNGEVYNFPELRRELQATGHRFRTDTDTEVLLAAYREWGEGMLERLNGMWAFVIWDRRNRILFGARDRFGVKPLLYSADGDRFAFASELKGFAAMPGMPLELDAATLAFSPMVMETVGPTLLRGVRSLPPGHLFRVEADGRVGERAWWSTAEHLQDVPRDYDDQVERFRELLEDACRVRLRADVPLGTSLSGGLDSSSVVAMIHRIGGQQGFTTDWQRIFSQGNLGTTQDESVWAARVAAHLGTGVTWTDVSVENELARLEESVLAFEGVHILPLGLWSHYRSVREHGVKISIDGHGGDELLGGYPRFTDAMRRRSLMRFRPHSWARYAAATSDHTGTSIPASQLCRADVRKLLDPRALGTRTREHPRFLELRGALSGALPLRTASGGIAAAPDDLAERTVAVARRLRGLQRETRGLTPLGAMLYAAFHHGILPSILRNFDRLSMASGVEIRSPLLDWRLVTFALALPDAARISDGWTKRILRDATTGLLPSDVRFRRDKMGFSSPMLDWLGRGLGDRAVEIVSDDGFLSRPTWDGPAIRDRVVRAHRGRDWSAVKTEWPLIQAELLMRGLRGLSATTERAR
jgi:asparagine synthase (glutamine-hydrolysing)